MLHMANMRILKIMKIQFIILLFAYGFKGICFFIKLYLQIFFQKKRFFFPQFLVFWAIGLSPSDYATCIVKKRDDHAACFGVVILFLCSSFPVFSSAQVYV